MTSLSAGDQAPDFDLPAHDGSRVVLSELVGSGKGAIVYFYPKAATPGCTTEACDFRDNEAALAAAGYSLVGISADPVADLESFAADNHVTFPFASDEDHAVGDAYGTWGTHETPFGVQTGNKRSTFVVDPEMRLTHVEYGVDPNGHVARLREVLGA
ncbi:peroxiredoxin [Georgenia sp. Z1344]|uniref:peroxiredoxin n=1 Tax=Georgenia sp. Z1344 TaxID=3416706 RepID=UPI003CE7AF65